jgi:hypothetical protein
METVPEHTVDSLAVERKMEMVIDVSGLPDVTEHLGSKRSILPQKLLLSYFQEGADIPVSLRHAAVRGPLRLKSGKLSAATMVNVNSYFWKLDADELEELDLVFPHWVRILVEEYWPASI